MLLYGQIPLCRLPRDVRDKPVTSPLAQIPLRRLPRTEKFRCPGKFRGSRRNGIWALPSDCQIVVENMKHVPRAVVSTCFYTVLRDHAVTMVTSFIGCPFRVATELGYCINVQVTDRLRLPVNCAARVDVAWWCNDYGVGLAIKTSRHDTHL